MAEFNEQDEWAEYEPFDRAGLKKWTHVFEWDDDDCDNRVAVYDPYGTCGLVLCAKHNGGAAGAGPIDYPPWDDEDDFDDDAFDDDDFDEENQFDDEVAPLDAAEKLSTTILGFPSSYLVIRTISKTLKRFSKPAYSN
jgi:hypothetical protein